MVFINDGKKILIIDNEPENCWALEQVMESMGLVCYRASTTQAALDLMVQHNFRMAFLDTTFPDGHSLELARHLRILDPNLRIIIVTDNSSDRNEQMSEALNENTFCACIYKPFVQRAISDAVKVASEDGYFSDNGQAGV